MYEWQELKTGKFWQLVLSPSECYTVIEDSGQGYAMHHLNKVAIPLPRTYPNPAAAMRAVENMIASK